MTRNILLALALLAPGAALAADYPIRFGEIRNGAVVPTDTLKMCAGKTGYEFGFEIELPAGKHEVAGDMHWPPAPGTASASGAHAQESYGAQSGRFVKRFAFDPDDQTGDYSLQVIVDRAPVRTVKFKVVRAASCP